MHTTPETDDVTITTRLATPADAPAVHALTQAAFATLEGRIDPPSSARLETVEAVAAALADGGGGIAELAGEPVGAVRFQAAEDHLYVGRVAVAPEHRGRGVARALMALMALAERHAASAGLPEMRVEVRQTLTSNVALFQHLGYVVVAERPHPNRPESTVLMLAKPVAPAPLETVVDG